MTQPEPHDYTADDRIEDELGPGEPDEVIDDPDNAAAAEAIRASTLDQPQLEEEET
jgi:hypothetical protein